jgi:hypothetical protein
VKRFIYTNNERIIRGNGMEFAPGLGWMVRHKGYGFDGGRTILTRPKRGTFQKIGRH